MSVGTIRNYLPDFRSGMTVAEAQDKLACEIEKGTECICCGQFAKEYKRPLNSSMAMGLCLVVKQFRKNKKLAWLHVEKFFKSQEGVSPSLRGDFAKLRHWKLVRQKPNNDESKRTSGMWRPTKKGIHFVLGHNTVSKYLRVYNNEVIQFSGPKIGINTALGKKFDYAELMGEK